MKRQDKLLFEEAKEKREELDNAIPDNTIIEQCLCIKF